MLRAIPAVLGALAIAFPFVSHAMPCLWLGVKDGLIQLQDAHAAPAVSLALADARGIAMDARDCGVWVLGREQLRRYDEAGQLASQFPLDGIDRKPGHAMRAVVGSESGVWLLADRSILRINGSGGLEARVDLRGSLQGDARHLSVDGVGGSVWVASNRQVVRVDGAGEVALRIRAEHSIEGIAADPLTGHLWVAESRAVVLYDAAGVKLRSIDLSPAGLDRAEAIAFDAITRTLWLWTHEGAAQVSTEGERLALIRAAAGRALVATRPVVLQPLLTLVEPPQDAVTSNARRTITLRYDAACNGSDCALDNSYFGGFRLQATLNGQAVGSRFTFDPATRQASLTPELALPEGMNSFIASAHDAQGRATNTITVRFTVDAVAPAVTIRSPVPGLVTGLSQVDVAGSVNEPAIVLVNDAAVPVSQDGSFTATVSLQAGLNVIRAVAIDRASNTGSAQVPVTREVPHPGPPPAVLPPDPALVATPVDPSVPSRVGDSTAFLYSGAQPVQFGVTPGTIEPRRAAVLRGRVITREGRPLPGVKVTVKNHPEFGHTLSRADGMFDMAVNGGGVLVLDYEGAGLLPVQRTIDAPWNDWVRVPDAALVALDTRVTTIQLGSAMSQAARSTPTGDERGSRQVTMLFAPGTMASLLMADGTEAPAASLSVRATEYTVGPGGEAAMPGRLPPTTDYTYAVELSADEAVAAGAKGVVFSQPVMVYVDNFLGLPAGANVPSGYYDRSKSAWIGSDNGRVIRILSTEAGLAVLDVNGQGQAATPAHLARLGISDEERVQLAALFAPGQSLWRVPVKHFTPYDFNWLKGGKSFPTGCDESGKCIAQVPERDPETCEVPGCIIEAMNQVLGEVLGIAGTPFSLHYRSSRVPGGSGLRIPLSGNDLPDGVQSIRLEITVAGQTLTKTFAPSNRLAWRFDWDGKDAYGRTLAGRVNAQVRIGYTYKLPLLLSSDYLDAAAEFLQSWGAPGTLQGPVGEDVVTAWSAFNAFVDAPMPGSAQHLGGWGLDANHVYDSYRGILMRGDGTVRSTPVLAVDSYTQPGAGSWAVPPGLAVQADGSVLVSGGFGTGTNGGLRRITRTGEVTSLTGTATARTVTLGAGEGIFITGAVGTNGRDGIFRVNADGTLKAIAGVPAEAQPADPASAAIRQLIYPRRIAADREGNIYFTQRFRRQGSSLVPDCRVRRVNLSGTISDIAGNGTCDTPGGDGGPALAAGLGSPESIAVDDAANVYVTDGTVVRRITPEGVIATVAGTRAAGDASDGRPGAQVWLGVPNPTGQQPLVLGLQALSVDRSGHLLVTAWNRVLRLGKDGILRTVLGSTATTCVSTLVRGVAANGACARGLGATAEDPQGRIFVIEKGAADGDYVLRKVDPMLPAEAQGEVMVASADGAVLDVFDAKGRHLRSEDALMRTRLVDFGYDSGGRLITVRDGDGLVTRIERAADGVATGIVSPWGQRSTLAFDAAGYLARLTNPAGESFRMAYTASGLMTQFTTPMGTSNHFTYDATGLLLQDRDAAGGGWDLLRDESNGEVTMTSMAGRATKYRSIGGVERVVTKPGGIATRALKWPDGNELLIKPNGTQVLGEHGPDPRFGVQAPVAKRTVVTLPSGLEFTQTAARTATTSGDGMNVVTQTDSVTVGGRTWTSTFDATQRMRTSTSPLGRKSIVKLDDKARPVQSATDGIEPLSYSYDMSGRVAAISQGTGPDVRMTTMAYDTLGRLGSVTDPLGRSTSYAYDAADRVVRQTMPDGRVVGFTYDANGNLTSITPPSRPVHGFDYTAVDLQERYVAPAVGGIAIPATRYAYDLDKLLTSITRPDGLVIDFGRDTVGRVNIVSTPNGTTTYAYSATSGELTGLTTSDGIGLSYAYDGDLLTSETWSGPVAGTVSRSYDTNFDLSTLDVAGARYALTYDADRLLTGVGGMTITRDSGNGFVRGTQLGGLATSQSYGAFGELQSLVASQGTSTLYSETLAYDRAGRVMGKTEQAGGLTDSFLYGYDAAGRLATVSKNGSQVNRFEYDANGNRTSDGVNTATYDMQDRLIRYGSATYTYSDNGELKTKRVGSEVTKYEYDVLGNLRKVETPDGRVIEYLIDGRNRRIGRKVDGVFATGLLYLDQLNPVVEIGPTGEVSARFLYGTRSNVPDYMEKEGRTYRFVTDRVGSVRLVVDVDTGEVVQRLVFDAFGVILENTNPGFQPFGFAGGLFDHDTGFTRFGARDYDAATARWTAKDPIGFRGGDQNLYSYVGGDPVTRSDPLGLDWIDNAADFTAGWGDMLSFGITASFRQAFNIGSVDKCSASYAAGKAVGFANGLSIGWVQGTKATAKALSPNNWTNFSHSLIPHSAMRGSKSRLVRWMDKTGNRLNGDYLPAGPRPDLHDLMDPVAASIGGNFRTWPAWRQLVNRMPYVPGSATYGVGSAAMSGQCGCD